MEILFQLFTNLLHSTEVKHMEAYILASYATFIFGGQSIENKDYIYLVFS